MPNRYIREGINDSKPINSLSWQAEVFYRRLMLKVDDFGRFEADAELLRCELFKRQIAKVSEEDIERLLAENQRAQTLFTYESGGKRFLVLNKWERGRALKSKHPEPPEAVNRCLQMFADANGCSHPPPTSTSTSTSTPVPTPTPTKLKASKGPEKRESGAGEGTEVDRHDDSELGVVARFIDLIGRDAWANDSGKWIVARYRKTPALRAKLLRVLVECELRKREGLQPRLSWAAFAEDTWKRFA